MISRIARILSHRLPVILGVSLLAAAGSAWLVTNLNDEISPRFEATATAPIVLQPTESGKGQGFTQPNLGKAVDEAIDANDGFLDADHRVRPESSTQEIAFSAVADTPETAETEATEMRNRYLVAVAPDAVEQRMQSVLQKAALVREQLSDLSPTTEVASVDPEVVTKRDLLTSQINALNSEIARLSVEQVLEDNESEREAILEDIRLMLALMVELRTELDALPAIPTDAAIRGGGASAEDNTGRGGTPTVAESDAALENQLQVESLGLLYSSLLQEFQDLYLASIDGDAEALPEPDVVDVTRRPLPVAMAAGIGLLGALLIVIVLILVADRLRPGWWAQRDVRGAIAEAPAAPFGAVPLIKPADRRRKRAVQSIAVSLLPEIEVGPVAIGLIGVATRPGALTNLALDLADSMVTTGRGTLIIDAVGIEAMEETHSAPLEGSGPSLSDLLNPWQQQDSDYLVDKSLDEALTPRPGLSILPSGGPSLYAIEGAMTPVVAQLLSAGRKRFPLTLVPLIDRGPGLCDAFASKLDATLIVGQMGETRLSQVEALQSRCLAVGNRVIGSILLLDRPITSAWRAAARMLENSEKPRQSGGDNDQTIDLTGSSSQSSGAKRRSARRPRRRIGKVARMVLNKPGGHEARHVSAGDETIPG